MRKTIRQKFYVRREKKNSYLYKFLNKHIFAKYHGGTDDTGDSDIKNLIRNLIKYRREVQALHDLGVNYYFNPRYHSRKELQLYDNEPDTRSGYETYGYDDLESIKTDLDYISDRFNATFRLRWILDLLDQPELVNKLLSN